MLRNGGIMLLLFALGVAATAGAARSDCNRCTDTQTRMKQARERHVQDASQIFYQTIKRPSPVSITACLGDIWDVGIDVSILDPSNLLEDLIDRACEAARDRIRNVEYSLLNEINEELDLPYGLGGRVEKDPGVDIHRRDASQVLWHILN